MKNIIIEKYLRELIEANKTQNLISRRSTENELEVHVKDSLELTRYVGLKNQRALDIGSGQGFPAIPLAIMEPECNYVLVESDLKKAEFLAEMKDRLVLPNVEVLRYRIEELGREDGYRNSFDTVTCRAVAGLPTILEWGLPLLKMGGTLVAWKGSRALEEVGDSEKAMRILGGFLINIQNYDLEGKSRSLVMIKKVQDTPDRYPRRGGLAKKRPLV